MQRIDRLSLDAGTVERLSAYTAQVRRSADPARKAQTLWRSLPRPVKTVLQEVLARMSTGLQRCMYCEDGQGTDIEHFRPKSTYPQHAFDWLNYLLACSHCNSNHKRTAFPLDADGVPLLIDPTVDDPLDHLLLSPTTGLLEPVTDRGSATVEVCGLNREVCAGGRQNAWVALNVLMQTYDSRMATGREQEAAEILRVIKRYPFQSVRAYLVHIVHVSSRPQLLLGPETLNALRARPELTEDV